ncbi:MAG: hypothetical protein ACRDJJ_06390, partial [Actinomycetota bacterium]
MRILIISIAIALVGTITPGAEARDESDPPGSGPPVVGAGVTRGRGRTVFVGHDPTTAKRIDGEISD